MNHEKGTVYKWSLKLYFKEHDTDEVNLSSRKDLTQHNLQ